MSNKKTGGEVGEAVGKFTEVGEMIASQIAHREDDEPEEVAEVIVPIKETAEQKIARQQSMKIEEGERVEKMVTKFLKSEPWTEKYLNKGSISNFITFAIMVLGIILFFSLPKVNGKTNPAATYILSAGLFGFAGGVTNWLAIKMLFDKIPFLYGSGIIPRQFKMIRTSIKTTIMEAFFDPDFLENYATDRAKELLEKADIPSMVATTLNNPAIHATLVLKLKQAAKQKNASGRFLSLVKTVVPGGIEGLVKTTRPIVAKMAGEIVPPLLSTFDLKQFVEIKTLQKEIDALMTEKLELLTPEMVKELLERVVRTHLGWLVVWGNIFGGLIGILSNAAGFGPS